MRNILLVATVGVVMNCGIIDVHTKMKEVISGGRAKRQVLKDNLGLNSTWRGGVFYMFNTSDHVVQATFKMGVKVWSDLTCVDFVEDKNAEDKIVVVKANLSYADVGRLGGDQILALDRTATEGSAVHEIGHVLGLHHTMKRYDRDSFIEIVTKNVIPDYISDFDILNSSVIDVYGLTYDYGSVMHYSELSFSANRQPTLIAKDPLYQKTMGSDLISFSDVFMINEHYGCNEKCNTSTSATCANGGFPHPRNCSICICPGGYGGALCDRRPPGCGEDLVATNKGKVLKSSLGSGVGFRDHFLFCNYMITAPEGKKIKIHVLSISLGYDIAGCQKGGIEVKAQMDQKLTGYRVCANKKGGIHIVSSSNRVPVILYNRYGKMETVFVYRYIN